MPVGVAAIGDRKEKEKEERKKIRNQMEVWASFHLIGDGSRCENIPNAALRVRCYVSLSKLVFMSSCSRNLETLFTSSNY